jgi:hypothetical protein
LSSLATYHQDRSDFSTVDIFMTKRDFIYIALLVSLAVGAVIDVFTWQDQASSAFTLNDLTQLIAIVVLCVWWEIEDAKLRGQTARTLTRTTTILFVPLGLLAYFLQSRKPLPALLGYAGFILGAFLAAMAGSYIGESLIAYYPTVGPTGL